MRAEPFAQTRDYNLTLGCDEAIAGIEEMADQAETNPCLAYDHPRKWAPWDTLPRGSAEAGC